MIAALFIGLGMGLVIGCVASYGCVRLHDLTRREIRPEDASYLMTPHGVYRLRDKRKLVPGVEIGGYPISGGWQDHSTPDPDQYAHWRRSGWQDHSTPDLDVRHYHGIR